MLTPIIIWVTFHLHPHLWNHGLKVEGRPNVVRFTSPKCLAFHQSLFRPTVELCQSISKNKATQLLFDRKKRRVSSKIRYTNDYSHSLTDDYQSTNKWENTRLNSLKNKPDYSNDRIKARLKALSIFNDASSHVFSNIGSPVEDENVSKQRHRRTFAGSRDQEVDPSLPPLNIDLPYNDQSQLNAIRSNAPAILLSSGPGTGKTHVLALRIAYLLRKQLECDTKGSDLIGADVACSPDSIVILSFTNRDAERLKERALDSLFPTQIQSGTAPQIWRNQTSQQLWSGTMHAFSLSILQKYCFSMGPTLRVLPSREMRNRVSMSIRSMLNFSQEISRKFEGSSNQDNTTAEREQRDVRLRHFQALNDVGHSRSILHQNIVRCIDLWKEANLLCFPETNLLHANSEMFMKGRGSVQVNNQRESPEATDCVELAMRLGVPRSSASLALDVFPFYQGLHAASGTIDPSDLASLAYRHLVINPDALHVLRSKLRHIIVDEYQDLSVSQHALLRLIVRGASEEDESSSGSYVESSIYWKQQLKQHCVQSRLPILLDPHNTERNPMYSKNRAYSRTSFDQSYNVPNLFCAGDANQSIYGWRGASPLLTIDGFRKDYPQGIVAPLGTCYRLPSDIMESSNMLLTIPDLQNIDSTVKSYFVSPAAAAKLASTWVQPSIITTGCNNEAQGLSVNHDIRLGESLLLSKGLRNLDSTMVIHGLWDAREEAKYVASTIIRRSKERIKALINAMKSLNIKDQREQIDVTDVAVMVRSSHQLEMLKEAFINARIPFMVKNEKNDVPNMELQSKSWLPQYRSKLTEVRPMKPTILMTMHRSKGEEFDDVYLIGWEEGNFPHPEVVKSNRVHEERRLAYVAITRARQRVVITHSLIRRTLYYGKEGCKRFITSQVQPSRFLYELVPSKRSVDGFVDSKDGSTEQPLRNENKGLVWNRDAGIKEIIAGTNIPSCFYKSYQQPAGYVSNRASLCRHTNVSFSGLANTKPSNMHSDYFNIGDQVVVRNDHKKHGMYGPIKRKTACYVFFQDVQSMHLVKIKPTSLRKSSDAIIHKNDFCNFKIGDKVMVSNEDHLHYGKMGIIEKVTKSFVFLRQHETNQTIQIKPASLKK